MAISHVASAATADSLPPGVVELLARLDPEQRAAAVLPDGPAQIIAPAGSGKTTALIARLGVLLGRGVAADRIGVVTFNRAAAAELAARIVSRLAPDVPGAAATPSPRCWRCEARSTSTTWWWAQLARSKLIRSFTAVGKPTSATCASTSSRTSMRRSCA